MFLSILNSADYEIHNVNGKAQTEVFDNCSFDDSIMSVSDSNPSSKVFQEELGPPLSGHLEELNDDFDSDIDWESFKHFDFAPPSTEDKILGELKRFNLISSLVKFHRVAYQRHSDFGIVMTGLVGNKSFLQEYTPSWQRRFVTLCVAKGATILWDKYENCEGFCDYISAIEQNFFSVKLVRQSKRFEEYIAKTLNIPSYDRAGFFQKFYETDIVIQKLRASSSAIYQHSVRQYDIVVADIKNVRKKWVFFFHILREITTKYATFVPEKFDLYEICAEERQKIANFKMLIWADLLMQACLNNLQNTIEWVRSKFHLSVYYSCLISHKDFSLIKHHFDAEELDRLEKRKKGMLVLPLPLSVVSESQFLPIFEGD